MGYNKNMHNWDYPKTKKAWGEETRRLERLLNFGLAGEKIDRRVLEKYLDKIKMPEDTRAFLELLLWDKAF